MYDFEWLDVLPADLRMVYYLEEAFSGEDREDRIAKLAIELGYSRPHVVQSWITGKTKIPLKALMPLASAIGVDVNQLIPLWLSQEMSGTGDDRLYQAGKRMLSAWEFMLVSVARDIYDQGEEE